MSKESEFWNRCLKAQCFVAPVRTYSDCGDDGTYMDEKDYIGVRYVALPFCEYIYGKSYSVRVDEDVSYLHAFETPEAALIWYEDRKEVNLTCKDWRLYIDAPDWVRQRVRKDASDE